MLWLPLGIMDLSDHGGWSTWDRETKGLVPDEAESWNWDSPTLCMKTLFYWEVRPENAQSKNKKLY